MAENDSFPHLIEEKRCANTTLRATTNTISCFSLTAKVTWMEKDKQIQHRVKSNEKEIPSLHTKCIYFDSNV